MKTILNIQVIKGYNGFTLIEMAIVLVIIGLLVGGLLSPLSTQIEIGQRKTTDKSIENIKEALLGFALARGRLPCPDTDGPPDGLENQTGATGNCTNVQGVLPWSTLGVDETDVWGTRFTYRVTAPFADNVPAPIVPATFACAPITVPTNSSFALCSQGDITVLDAVGGANVAINIPAIVVSHGKNGINATSNNETENTDVDSNFVSRTYTNVAGSEFDDIVGWISTNILLNRMITAQRLP